MKVIGYTDVIQVLVLIIGGLVTSYIALTLVSEKFGFGKDALAGFNQLFKSAPGHFKMIFDKPGPDATAQEINRYASLPGLAMLAAGMWVANLNYWGCNQYITQRALGADLKTARTGILFAGMLKLMMPLLVVLPASLLTCCIKMENCSRKCLPMASFAKTMPIRPYLDFFPKD